VLQAAEAIADCGADAGQLGDALLRFGVPEPGVFVGLDLRPTIGRLAIARTAVF